MDHYIKELKPIPLTKEDRAHPDTGVSDPLHVDYMSVTGGVGWLAQFRYDASVYIGALQRATQKPTIDNCISVNRLLKWLKRTPAHLIYKRLEGPLRIMVITDSAFKRTDPDGLATRGHLVMVGTMLKHKDGNPEEPSLLGHIMDGISRRHKRVARSTYAAELHGAADAVEPAKLLAMIYT